MPLQIRVHMVRTRKPHEELYGPRSHHEERIGARALGTRPATGR